jgi:serine/threonine protein kinase
MQILEITMDSRYQILEEINQGGAGIIQRAWDTRLQRIVAIKRFLPPGRRSDGGAIHPDLMREATMLSAMQHPNIVSIYDVLPDDPGGPCVVMEYLNGKDLEQAVAAAALTVADFYKVAEQTLDALSHAHRLNLLHRDIKPANLQITWLANGTFICKFVDFGLARFFEKPSKQTVRADGTVMGSVFYMAPEQLERGPLDGRADLYSLGCVFYFLLSMHRPFEGQTMQQVIAAHLANNFRPLRHYRPQLPEPLHDWVHWLMERRAEQRPADAAAALAVLRHIQLGQLPA